MKRKMKYPDGPRAGESVVTKAKKPAMAGAVIGAAVGKAGMAIAKRIKSKLMR